MINQLKAVLLSIELFSSLVVGLALHKYQVTPASAVIDSCLYARGREFLWVFPRQSGKDETIAQLVTFLLTLFHRVEASIIHVYPTNQQITTGATRLQNRLANRFLGEQFWTKSKPVRLGLGRAQCAFFSGHPQAKAEGATANLLLIVNEVQDQVEVIVERRFTPMRASTNATALYVGTVRTTHDYLWSLKGRLERLEAADGVKRVFFVSAEEIARENRHYGDFVAGQVKLKGRQHPAVKTELFNEPLDTAAGLFPPRRLALMAGSHDRLPGPKTGEVYLVTVDVGGQDEAATDPLLVAPNQPMLFPFVCDLPNRPDEGLQNPGRDYTVATVARVLPSGEGTCSGSVQGIGPIFQVVDVFEDQGSRHFQDYAGRPSLFARLLAYLNHWQAVAVICDATGVGQGLADALVEKFTRQVVPFDFAKANGKARLGNDFLALVETGRFQYFSEPSTSSPLWGAGGALWGAGGAWGDEGSDAWWFATQCRFCAYELAEGAPIERGLRWSVPQSCTITLATGATVPVHDDRLLSAALLAEADRLIRAGELFVGASQSAVIRPIVSAPDDDRDVWS